LLSTASAPSGERICISCIQHNTIAASFTLRLAEKMSRCAGMSPLAARATPFEMTVASIVGVDRSHGLRAAHVVPGWTRCTLSLRNEQSHYRCSLRRALAGHPSQCSRPSRSRSATSERRGRGEGPHAAELLILRGRTAGCAPVPLGARSCVQAPLEDPQDRRLQRPAAGDPVRRTQASEVGEAIRNVRRDPVCVRTHFGLFVLSPHQVA
jgi:hypothetical protein